MTTNGEFKIEKGVAPPWHGPLRKYPFPDMEIGDSFFVETSDEGDKIHKRAKLAYAASVWKKRHGQTFTVRTVEGGVRVWRTA